MLHRSFKPAKCKTALKLAASRIKLLKNKREAQVKQLKKELAQLLESGQDQTARIRVEHVVREEKTMAAYDLVEIYCELIVARLPIIESQKNCPIDLKEAIASVIFASPRCADIPELMDVRKHFTAKYGKEFVNAAVEVRPNCGVSRLLVEKLSANAPDGPTKIKFLSAIAEEHNIKWDPQSFGEKDSKPSEDLLNGPNTFEKASKMSMASPYVLAPQPSYVQTPQPSYVQTPQPSYVQVPPNSNERHDVPSNFGEHNVRSPLSQTDAGSRTTNWSSTSHSELRPSGSVNEGREFRHSHSGNGNSFSPGRQNWNMEFKDATAAAQAAAESAERASMAARAAAELSSRENTTWKYSAESPRDEETKKFANQTLQTENYAEGPINNALNRRNSRTNYEHIDTNQQDHVAGISENFRGDSFKSVNKLSDSASLKSSTAPIDGSPSVNDLQMSGRYSRKNSSENEQGDSLGQVSLKKQSGNFEVESVNKLQDHVNFNSVDDFEEVNMRRQSSHASSHSRSSTSIDDHNVVSSFQGDVDENPFAVNNEGTFQRNSNETSSYENAAVVFDDYGLDEYESRSDIEGKHKGDEYGLDFSSPSRKAPPHVFASTNAWTDGEYINESLGKSGLQSRFSRENRTDPVVSEHMTSSTFSQPDNVLPATFDNSDGPSSESEEELDNSKLDWNAEASKRTVYSRTSEVTQDESRQFMDSSFADKGYEGSSKSSLQPSPFDVNSVDLHSDGNQGIRVNPRSSRKFGYGDVTTSQSSPTFRTSQLNFNDMDGSSYNNSLDERKHWQSQQTSSFSMGREVKGNVPQVAESVEDTEISKDSSLEGRSELNFENLTGGLRNKGYRRPPYIMSPSGNASSTRQTTEDSSNKMKEPCSATVEVSVSPGATNQDPYNREVSAEADKKPSIIPHFGSCDDDSDDEHPQHSSTSSREPYSKKAGFEKNKRSSSSNQVRHLDSAASDSEGDTSNQAFTSKPYINTALSRRTKASTSNSKKTTVMSESSITPDYGEERNPPSMIWFGTETRQNALSQNQSSGRLGSFEQPRPAEQAAYKSNPESKRLSSEESLKSSAKEQPSYSPPKKVISGASGSFKPLSSSVESPSKEKKASHVHPKLPDYETLTAHLQSLRQNRQ